MTTRIQNVDFKPAVVNEDSTLAITGVLTDETGTAIPGTSLASCTLTLYDVATDGIINSRDAEDISANVDGEGALELILHPEDNPIVTAGAAGTKERHVALLHFTWASNPEGRWQEIQIDVVRIHRVPE